MLSNMLRISVLLFIAVFTVLFIVGCGGGGVTTGNLPGETTSSNPVMEPVINTTTNPGTVVSSLHPMAGAQKSDPTADQEPYVESKVETATISSAAVLSPKPLSAVGTWAIQLQNIEATGTVTTLVNSAYDLLVIEPVSTCKGVTFDTKTMVSKIKASYAGNKTNRKLVLAYIDIGQAEDYRYYWTWSATYSGDGPLPSSWPTYIAGPNAAGWAGDYPVAYWDPAWKDIVIYGNNPGSGQAGYKSLVDEAIQHGFDGVFLDCINSYQDPSVIARAKKDGKDAASEMVNFVKEIRTYAQGKSPGFIIMQNNAIDLGVTNPTHMQNIDIINQEAVWYNGSPTGTWTDSTGYDQAVSASSSQYMINQLKAYKNAGKVVCDIEYANKYAANAYSNGAGQGYLTYCTRTSLSRLTTTLPPPPSSATPTPIINPTATPVPTANPTATPVPTAKPTATQVPPTPTPTSGGNLSPIPLSQVKNWAIQLQNITTSQVNTLAASRYNLFIVEANDTSKSMTSFNTKAMTNQIKSTYAGSGPYRKLVFAYIDIGEAENWRTYWTWSTNYSGSGSFPADWPGFILGANSNWAGDYPVAFWDTNWKNFIIYNQDSLLNQAINDGFDGIFMDVVDVYQTAEVTTRAASDGKNASQEMVKFLSEIRTYARSKNPNFMMIQNNGTDLINDQPTSANYIDAIHQECIWYQGTTAGWNVSGSCDVAVPSSWRSAYLQNLALYKNAGKTVLDLEYAKTYATTAYNNGLAQGYITYCTQMALSNLSTTPPSNY